MLKEALQYIRDMAVASEQKFTFDTTGKEDVVIDRVNGKVVRTQKPVHQQARFSSVEDLIRFAGAHTWLFTSYFISNKRVIAVDQDEPRNYASVELEVNPIVAVLQNCREMEHAAAMRRLRVDFAAVEIEPETFRGVLGKLKFATGSDTESAIGKGDESLSRKVRASVTGESEIPEEIVVRFPVYPTLDLETACAVECSVIIDPTSQRISIVPIPGQLEQAMLTAQEKIKDYIEKNTTLPVYRGAFMG